LTGTRPVGVYGFPALSPDSIHVAFVAQAESGALRLGVRRVDDGREVFDEAILTEVDLRLRRGEGVLSRERRLAHTAKSRSGRVQRTLDRVVFAPMVKVSPPALAPLALAECSHKRLRLLHSGGPFPSYAGCTPTGCAGQARVLEAWRGGEPGAGLGVEALLVDGAGAGCGPGPRWSLKAL
jgi:hypothetical protein